MLKPRVLVAEDSADLRDLYCFMLAQAGFEVTEVADGQEAFEELQRERPDVFVTDIMMPRMTGVDLVRRIRGDAALADLPVVVVSAFADYLAKAYVCGAARVIRKPFDPEKLLDAVRQVLPAEAGN
jgi:two-component system, OmpR family, response regulator MtrA